MYVYEISCRLELWLMAYSWFPRMGIMGILEAMTYDTISMGLYLRQLTASSHRS